MTYSPPPTFTVGEVATSTDLNTMSGDIASLAAATFPIGISGAAAGTPPAAGPGFKWQAGYVSTTADASGNLGVTFPTSFPAGVIGVWFSMVYGAPFPAIAEATSISTSGFVANVLNTTTGSAVASTAVSVCWFAIGF